MESIKPVEALICSWRRTIDETDNEANETEFEIGSTRARVGNVQSENDSEGDGQKPSSSSGLANRPLRLQLYFIQTRRLHGATVGCEGKGATANWESMESLTRKLLEARYITPWIGIQRRCLNVNWERRNARCARIRGKGAGTAWEARKYTGKETPRLIPEMKVRAAPWPKNA
ncbi:MAG: hypothetical protein M1813_000340 [Trichoglossum hirsutum]|nr:MAG: hypothetical protein M1813_000340 [Trichoglossum hirsutum]